MFRPHPFRPSKGGAELSADLALSLAKQTLNSAPSAHLNAATSPLLHSTLHTYTSHYHSRQPSLSLSRTQPAAMGSISGDYEWIVVLGAFAALFAAFGIGANDVANA